MIREALEDQVKRLQSLLALMNAVSDALTHASTIEKMLDMVYEQLLPQLPFESLAFLWTHDEGEQPPRLLAYSHWHLTDEQLRDLLGRAVQAFGDMARCSLDLAEVESICRSNDSDEGLTRETAADSRAYHLPMLARDRIFGVIQLQRHERAPLSAEDFSVFTAIAGHISAALYNQILLERNQRMAVTDQLTQLGNRRHLHDALERECQRVTRYASLLGALVLDIDHFKNINDTYGHQVGDEVLKELALRMKQAVRRPDMVFRYGGEEFVILLPETDEAQANVVAARMVEAIRATPFATSKGDLNVTISAGVADASPQAPLEGEALLGRADKALYAAKEMGRNQARLYSKLA